MTVNNASKIYKAVGAEAVLTSQYDLREYLTGFATSFGYVLSDKNGTVFYTDPRYIEGAAAALKGSGITVKLFGGSLEELLKPYKEVAVPLDKTLYPEFLKLSGCNVKIIDSTPAFNEAMAYKQPYEIDNIKKACEITDKAFLKLLTVIKEGMSENDVAAELEYFMRSYGASGTSFASIVGFAENSSVPHHETGMKKLKFGDIILIDFGCKYGGYCSDCTRTFLFGDDKKHGEFKDAYQKVLEAHFAAKEKIKDGVTGREADEFARGVLRGYGLDKFFTHSLGHGIGINVHERPMLSPKSADVLKENMVFSDEPGVYFEGKFGIRIEDTVTLNGGKVVSLTDSDKKLTII